MTILLGAFWFTHVRINQVRREAIDIADRNQKDVNRVADMVRAEFTMRTSRMDETQEANRKEMREDLKDARESSERFREEVRKTLSEMEGRLMGAIRSPARNVQR